VVDSSGVFHHTIRSCSCQSARSFHAQLLDMRLYPATMSRPETLFTFSVLDYFHIDSLECKTSALNFYNKLRRITNSHFPNDVPVIIIMSSIRECIC
jgi:hypothetical protein